MHWKEAWKGLVIADRMLKGIFHKSLWWIIWKEMLQRRKITTPSMWQYSKMLVKWFKGRWDMHHENVTWCSDIMSQKKRRIGENFTGRLYVHSISTYAGGQMFKYSEEDPDRSQAKYSTCTICELRTKKCFFEILFSFLNGLTLAECCLCTSNIIAGWSEIRGGKQVCGLLDPCNRGTEGWKKLEDSWKSSKAKKNNESFTLTIGWHIKANLCQPKFRTGSQWDWWGILDVNDDYKVVFLWYCRMGELVIVMVRIGRI